MTAPPGSTRVLVLDGEMRAALAAVRSLAARGHDVHVVSMGSDSLAGVSRWAQSENALGDPSADPKGWVERLDRVQRRLRADLLLPLTEVTLGILYVHGAHTRWSLAAPSPEAYQLAVDKRTVLERASTLGIDIPQSLSLDDPRELVALPPSFRFPVVLKARRSRFPVGDRWCEGGVRLVRNATELEQARLVPGFQAGLLVQEYVPGNGEAVFLLTDRGRSLATFAHRRLREKPPSGGVSVLRESIAPDPQLLEWSERLLADLEFSGAAMVEFRRSPEGRAVLMEINPRLWGSLQLAIDAGVDFPALLVALWRGDELIPPVAQLGVRTRWLLGDLDHLWISLRYAEQRAFTGQGRLRTLAGFLSSFRPGIRCEVWRRDDPRPFLSELKGILNGG